jgi:hypothetical protein
LLVEREMGDGRGKMGDGHGGGKGRMEDGDEVVGIGVYVFLASRCWRRRWSALFFIFIHEFAP